jgi:hypothetical protein
LKRLLLSVALTLVCCESVPAQDRSHVIAQVADGVFSDGTYYKSTFMITPWFETTAPTCSLRLYGLSVTLPEGRSDAFTVNVAAGGYYTAPTAADQPFHSGYATVTCTDSVFATILYTFYAANGTKLSEATVFSTEGQFNSKLRLILDNTGGSRVGVAIANNTDLPHNYRLTLGNKTATVQVPGRSTSARFVDELMSVPANTTGLLKVESIDLSSFGVIGLRYTGGVFTTIPAN